ncbi:MAG: hypothetical protein EOS41_07765 [Mesorhizobium sp.]|nr:MAG: hypothetical protein EOS41_07765 [Mesorhizobium sp.]
MRVGRGADAKTVAAVIRALEGNVVIGPTGAVQIMVATKPVDLRKGAEGLAALVRETMGADPFLCVGRDYVAEPSWRQPEPAQLGTFRHIIFRCCSAVAGRHRSVGSARRDCQPS